MRKLLLTTAAVAAAICLALYMIGCGDNRGGDIDCYCDGKLSEPSLEGHWIYVGGSVRYFHKNMFLFSDGTGMLDSESVTWKVDSGRLTIRPVAKLIPKGSGTHNYKLSCYELTILFNMDRGDSVLFVKRNCLEEYEKKCEAYKERLKKEREENTGYITDARDNRKYRVIKIGGKTWMAENLDYKTVSDTFNYPNYHRKKYGRWYDWNTAMTVCPSGWHLPSNAEWDSLAKSAGGYEDHYLIRHRWRMAPHWRDAGAKLKSIRGWYENGNGTDDYGFSALSGDGGYNGSWWTSTVVDSDTAYYRNISYSSDLLFNEAASKERVESVRCVQNENTYSVTVSSKGVGAGGSRNHVMAGEVVDIMAGTVRGQRFKCWMSANGNVTFAESSRAATRFIMPASDVTITASFDTVVVSAADRKTYKTTVIGGKRWMAENLNDKTSSGSWCYKNDDIYCKEYGRLYDWEAAMAACPAGWHLASNQEWNILVTEAGGNEIAGKKLKAKTGWNEGGNGTDDYGFSALPGGDRDLDGYYFDLVNIGNFGYWWTSTGGDGSDGAIIRRMSYWDNKVHETGFVSGVGCSVRCVADAP